MRLAVDRRYIVLLVFTVLVAALVMRHEISLLSISWVEFGRSRSFDGVLGILQAFSVNEQAEREHWYEIVQAMRPPRQYKFLLISYLAADFLAYMSAIALAVLCLPLLRTKFARAGVSFALIGLGISRVILLVQGRKLASPPEELPNRESVRSFADPLVSDAVNAQQASGLLIVFVAVAFGIRLITAAPHSKIRQSMRRVRLAVRVHRYSFAALIPLCLLGVLSGHPVLDQLPDVERAWLDSKTGTDHAVGALVCLTLLSVLTIALGQSRSNFLARYRTGARRDAANPLIWFVGPALVLIALPWVNRALILRERLAVFMAVPLFIALSSALLAWLWKKNGDETHPDRTDKLVAGADDGTGPIEVTLGTVSFVGVTAGLGILTVGGLGLVRAFTPVAALDWVNYGSPYTGDLVVLGMVLAIGPWLIALLIPPTDHLLVTVLKDEYGAKRAFMSFAVLVAFANLWLSVVSVNARLTTTTAALCACLLTTVFAIAAARWTRQVGCAEPTRFIDEGTAQRRDTRAGAIALVVCLGALAALGMAPEALGPRLGAAAVTILSVGATVGLVASTALILQNRATPELFRLMHLRHTPLVTILLGTLVAVGAASPHSTLHGIGEARTLAPTLRDDRPDLDEAFHTWVKRPGACEIAYEDHRVRPMIMIAAQGGGIRAAYWTVSALDVIEHQSPCARRSTLISTGASGGSVGLAINRFTPPDSAVTAREAVEAMASPDALAVGVVGATIRDVTYGATGVPMLDAGATDPKSWTDRARLIERSWIRSSSSAGPAWGAAVPEQHRRLNNAGVSDPQRQRRGR